jgi:hypothetical protein
MTFETFFGHTGYDIYFTVVCHFILMTPSVSFYRFPLRTTRITNARAEEMLLNLISETIIDSPGGKFHSRTSLSDSVD